MHGTQNYSSYIYIDMHHAERDLESMKATGYVNCTPVARYNYFHSCSNEKLGNCTLTWEWQIVDIMTYAMVGPP